MITLTWLMKCCVDLSMYVGYVCNGLIWNLFFTKNFNFLFLCLHNFSSLDHSSWEFVNEEGSTAYIGKGLLEMLKSQTWQKIVCRILAVETYRMFAIYFKFNTSFKKFTISFDYCFLFVYLFFCFCLLNCHGIYSKCFNVK